MIAWADRLPRAALVLTALLLLVLAFRHAGHRAPPESRPGVVPLNWLVPISPAKSLYESLARDFTRAHPDIPIHIIWVPGSQYPIKFKTLAAAGQAPDVFDTGDVWVAYMLPFLMDLTDLIQRDAAEIDVEDFYPEVLRASQYGGRFYFLPHAMNVSLLYYNKTAFDRAGLAYPTAGWTWDDLVRAGTQLTLRDASGTVTQWGCADVSGWWGEWLIYVRQAGGDLFSPDGSRCLLDSPAAQTGLAFFYDKVYRHAFSAAPGRAFTSGFAGGRYAMVVGGHVNEWRTLNAIPGLDWDIQVLPTGPARRAGGELALGAYGISKHTAHPEAAWTFLKYLTSREVTAQEVRGGTLAVRRSVAQQELLAPGRREAPRSIEAVYAQLPFAEPIPRMPDFIELALDVIQPEIDLMMQRSQTPEQAAQRATLAANAFLDTLGQRRTP